MAEEIAVIHNHNWAIISASYSKLPPNSGRNTFHGKGNKFYGQKILSNKDMEHYIRWENEGRTTITKKCTKCHKIKSKEVWGDVSNIIIEK